jgi:hypothetical protein
MEKSLLIMREDLGCYLEDRPNLPDKKYRGVPPKEPSYLSLEEQQRKFFEGNMILPSIRTKK